MRTVTRMFAKRLWPGLMALTGRDRVVGIGDLFGVVYATPLLLAGLAWLIAATDLSVVRTSWAPLLVLFLLVYALRRLDFTSYTELDRGLYASFGGSAEDMVCWPAALMFGPTALWMYLFWRTFSMLGDLKRTDTTALRWGTARSYALDASGDTLAGLAGLTLYYAVGGTHPPAGLGFEALTPAIFATLVRFLVPVIVSTPHLMSIARSPLLTMTPETAPKMRRFMWFAATWPLLVAPFAVFATGLYAEKGITAFLFIIGGTLFASALAHRMSRAVELSTERRRELRSLVRLSRAIVDGPPNIAGLPSLLKEHVSGMFAMCSLNIHLFPEETLLNDPEEDEPPRDVVWDFLQMTGETLAFPARQTLPWGETPRSYGTVLVPILHTETGEVLGGIAIRKRVRPEHVSDLVPAAVSLAAQIASALHGAEVFEQTLRTMRAEEELAVAADMQTSLMPSSAPHVPGWEFKAIIDSAREASGDFVDIVPLTGGRWGFLIADVSGKGVAAALYMAMVRTLIRTYAFEYQDEPGKVMAGANRRILTDSSDDSFVTAFYAVIDPANGTLRYANAGHNPPYLFRVFDGGVIDELRATGIPLGMLEGSVWEEGEITMLPGDRLLAYTDGATDAENLEAEPFGEERLLDVGRDAAEMSAIEMRTAVLDEIKRFVGEAEQEDDITIMIVAREAA